MISFQNKTHNDVMLLDISNQLLTPAYHTRSLFSMIVFTCTVLLFCLFQCDRNPFVSASHWRSFLHVLHCIQGLKVSISCSILVKIYISRKRMSKQQLEERKQVNISVKFQTQIRLPFVAKSLVYLQHTSCTFFFSLFANLYLSIFQSIVG